MPITLWILWLSIMLGSIELAAGADLAVPSNVLIRPPAEVPGAVSTLTAQQLCAKTFRTSKERPPADYTDKLKHQQLIAWHYASTNKKLYEEDHLISLEIGGDPKNPKNLWPEMWAGKCGAHVKDRLEDRLHALVCHKKLALTDAQHAIATDWVAAYNQYVGKLVCK